MPLFVRFLVDGWNAHAEHRLGLLQAVRILRDDDQFSARQFTRADTAMLWLADHLPSPPERLWRRRARPISWFRLSARAPIARVRDLAGLVAEMGYEVGAIVTASPGRIVYEDQHQVLAVPPPGQTF